MNSLKYFDQINLENVAGALIDGKLWFVGKDAAKALKYPRVTKALKDHVDAEDMCEISFQDAKGRWVYATVINESGLFSLIFSSQLPATKDFKRWIANEVLPQIRKTGGYNTASDGEEDNGKTRKQLVN